MVSSVLPRPSVLFKVPVTFKKVAWFGEHVICRCSLAQDLFFSKNKPAHRLHTYGWSIAIWLLRFFEETSLRDACSYGRQSSLLRKPLNEIRVGKRWVQCKPKFDYGFLDMRHPFFQTKLFLTSRCPFLITFTTKSYLRSETYTAYKFL